LDHLRPGDFYPVFFFALVRSVCVRKGSGIEK